MALADKNIIITPNIGETDDPKIELSGADESTSAQTITITILPDSGGTITMTGSAGELFSIVNSFSGTIFSVNDVSGIPSIEVIDDGTVIFAEFGGNVGIGTSTPGSKLSIVSLPTYADNSAATSAGLSAGDLYKTSSGVVMVTY